MFPDFTPAPNTLVTGADFLVVYTTATRRGFGDPIIVRLRLRNEAGFGIWYNGGIVTAPGFLQFQNLAAHLRRGGQLNIRLVSTSDFALYSSEH